MSRYLKIASQQGSGEFTSGQLLDFKINPDGIYSLSNSYLSFMVSAETTDVDNTIEGIYNVVIDTSGIPYKNNALIGDYWVQSDNYGIIDNVQKSNILNANLDVWGRDFESVYSSNYKTLARVDDIETFDQLITNSNFRQLKQVGESKEVTFECKVPLSDFSLFSRTEAFDTQAKGGLKYHIQFKNDVFSPKATYVNDVSGYPYNIYQCADKATTGARSTVITKPYYTKFTDLDISGTPCVIYGVVGGAGFVNQNTTNTVPAINAGAYTIGLRTQLPDAITITNCNITALDTDDPANVANAYIPCGDIVHDGTLKATYQLTTNNNEGAPLTYADATTKIGNECLIFGTGMVDYQGNAINYITTSIVSVERVGVSENGTNPLIYRFSEPFYTATGVDTTAIHLAILKHPSSWIPNEIAAPVSDISTCTLPNTSINRVNLWNGCKVAFGAIVGGAPVEVLAKVLSLVQSGPDVIITFDRVVVATGVTKNLPYLCMIKPVIIGDNAPRLVFSNANLVVEQVQPLHRLAKKLPNNNVYSYTKLMVEACNIPQNTLVFNKLFNIEANVINLFCVIVDANTLSKYISRVRVVEPGRDDNVSYYRWRVDNIDTHNRNIEPNTSLENDNIINTMSKSEFLFNSLNRNYGISEYEVFMPMISLTENNMPKSVLFTLGYVAPISADKILYLVKECVSSF